MMLNGQNRAAFRDASIVLPDNRSMSHTSCVWRGFRGPTSKPSLYNIYGDELRLFFCEMLGVKNATAAEALAKLQELRMNKTTTLADVVEIYLYVQDHCTKT